MWSKRISTRHITNGHVLGTNKPQQTKVVQRHDRPTPTHGPTIIRKIQYERGTFVSQETFKVGLVSCEVLEGKPVAIQKHMIQQKTKN